ncbi:hypothetical protein KSP39_PZI011153 [Platanthera zijinensis]|uniref:Uncharacterized protein n=1 Tax=Platanthera zijinensis TaxID=2320716 RepID=A0AAP0BIS6_9ASPA
MRPSSTGKDCRYLPAPTKMTIGGAPHYQTEPTKDGIDAGRRHAIGSHASDIGHSLRGTMRWSSGCTEITKTEITKTVQKFNHDCTSCTCCGNVLPLAVHNGCPTTQSEINFRDWHQTSRSIESRSYADDYEALRQGSRTFESLSYTDNYEALCQRSRTFESRSNTDDYEALRQQSRTFENISYADDYEAAEHILVEGGSRLNGTIYEKVEQERFQDDVKEQKTEYISEDYGELSVEINEGLHIVDGEDYVGPGYEEDFDGVGYDGPGYEDDFDVYYGDEDDYV